MGRTNAIIRSVLWWIFLAFYVATIVLVIVWLAIGKYEFIEIKHIVTSSMVGLMFVLVLVLADRILRIRISLTVMLFGAAMVILNSVGEIFYLYYKVAVWDVILHLLGGYGFTFIAFGMACAMQPPQTKGRAAMYLVWAVSFSLAMEALWEVLEWSVDNLIGTNMQKMIPGEPFFNGGSTRLPLEGTDEQIAEYFRQPSGYMFALQDTMKDIRCTLYGAIAFCLEYVIIGRRHPRYYNETFVKIPRKIKVKNTKSH